MYTKEDLKEKLNKNNRSLNTEEIDSYLKDWHIDAIYEDETGIEYFDELTIAKLNQGIILKEQDSTDAEIIAIINKEAVNTTPPPTSVVVPTVSQTNIQYQSTPKDTKLENITIDVTSQTLSLLADSIAEKISKELAERMKDNTFILPANTEKLKKDNEVLAGQVQQLLEENKKLVANLGSLVQEKAKFKQIFGSFYMKQE